MLSVLSTATPGQCFSLHVSATTQRSLFNLFPLSTTDYVLFSSILFIIKLNFFPSHFILSLPTFFFFTFSSYHSHLMSLYLFLLVFFSCIFSAFLVAPFKACRFFSHHTPLHFHSPLVIFLSVDASRFSPYAVVFFRKMFGKAPTRNGPVAMDKIHRQGFLIIKASGEKNPRNKGK